MSGAARPFPRRIPFVEHLGFELWGFGGGEAELRLDLAEVHLNYWDVAHGGVLMTMLDVAMAHAARSDTSADADGQGPGVATIEMKTSFLRPSEGRLRATGKLLHRTATLAFCEGSVLDEAGHHDAEVAKNKLAKRSRTKRHWKTKMWKRRTQLRRERADQMRLARENSGLVGY